MTRYNIGVKQFQFGGQVVWISQLVWEVFISIVTGGVPNFKTVFCNIGGLTSNINRPQDLTKAKKYQHRVPFNKMNKNLETGDDLDIM